MKRVRLTAAALSASLALAASVGAAGPADKAIEPAAVSALEGMAAYLRGLKVFQVDAVTTDEDVLDDGQKILTAGSAKILAQMPARLMAEVSDDRRERLYFYDGKTFTLFGTRLNLYATVPAPPSIGQLADLLDDKYGLSVPLADLFRWGGPNWAPVDITGAIDVGPSVVAGTTCEQYAFRQAEVDWQIWIQMGDHPLPRKLVITTKTDEARPQHTASYTWNLAPSFNEAAFKFDPPEGAGRVLLAEAKLAGAAR